MKQIIRETLHVRTDIGDGQHKISELNYKLNFKKGKIVQIGMDFIAGMEGTVSIKAELLRSSQETPRDLIKTITDNSEYKGWVIGEDFKPSFFVSIPFDRDDIIRTQVKCEATIDVIYPIQMWYVVEYESNEDVR